MKVKELKEELDWYAGHVEVIVEIDKNRYIIDRIDLDEKNRKAAIKCI